MLHQSPWAISPPRLVPANAGPGLRSCSSVGEYGVGDHHGDKDNITFFKISWLEMSWVGKKKEQYESSFCARVGWTEISEINMKLPISANQWCIPRLLRPSSEKWLKFWSIHSGTSAPTSSDKTCHCCQCVVLYMFVQTTWDLTESTMLPQFALCSLLYQMAYKRFSSFSPSVTASNIWK